MEKLYLDLDDGSSPSDPKQANPQEARKLSIQCCIQSLMHACQCRDANCRLPSCQKMKRVVTHIKVCKRKTNSGCPICKQLIALCCYHAKRCQETKCLVPFCSNIKHKLRQHQLQQPLQHLQLLRWHMAIMNITQTMPPSNTVTGANVPVLTSGPQNVVPGAVSPTSSINANTMSSTGMGLPFPYQADIGIKRGTQTLSTNVLQVVKQVQEEAARQQQPYVGYGKPNIEGDVPKQANPHEARKLSIQRCIQTLVHACQRHDANCRLPSCQKLKRIVNHTKVCKRKTSGGCPICKQLIALCCYHAKRCQETKCLVPFCSNIKHKLKQHQLQKHLQHSQLLRWHMAIMNTRQTMSPSNTAAGANVLVLISDPQNVVPGAVSPASSINVNTMSSTGMGLPSPHQPDIGIKLGIQTPPTDVLQVVKQVQEETARQQQSYVEYGKPNIDGYVPGQNMPPPEE